jgi:peptide chain release factor 3
MVIDAANGVESQTLRLLEVCRARNTPLITFINKMDREVKRPLELMDEIENALGMEVVPFTWPVGMGKSFAGVIDIAKSKMRLFKAGEDRVSDSSDTLIDIHDPALQERLGSDLKEALTEVDLIRNAMPEFNLEAFLAGKQSPVFFGSAINNFGVREILNTLVELAPPPGSRKALSREVMPSESKFSAVVFKIQANMDPAHRDRVAFLRICSGHFQRGMRLKICRNGKEVRTNNALSFLSQRRDILDEAFPGDIIGLPNHGLLRLGDTLTEGEQLQFTGLPFFAPEIFKLVESADPLRSKQLRTGLMQLGEEGAIQVFRPMAGGIMLLGAFGQLQFEVVAHRLKSEYGAEVRLLPARYSLARWVSSTDPVALKKFTQENIHRMAEDVVGAAVFLATHKSELDVAQQRWESIEFHALREHAGLIYQSELAG